MKSWNAIESPLRGFVERVWRCRTFDDAMAGAAHESNSAEVQNSTVTRAKRQQIRTQLNNQDWRSLISAHPLWFQVNGDSMWPTLKNGDRVFIEPLTEEPRSGMPVVIWQKDRLLVHRYEGRNITCGDNRLAPDPPFTDEQLIGTVRKYRRGGCVCQLSSRVPWRVQWRKNRFRLRRFLKLGIRAGWRTVTALLA